MLSSTIGFVVPMLVNLVSVPFLLRELGDAAFGLQSLVAVVIGYLAVMDMGLDLPVTKFLAEDRAKNDIEAENRMLSTSFQLYAVIGIVGMLTIVSLSEWFTNSVFLVREDLVSQSIAVFRLAGIGFLANIGLAWGRAVGMGLQRFEVTYSVSILNSVVGIGLGLGAVYAGYRVVGFVMMRVAVSLLAAFAYWAVVRRLLPTFRIRWGVDRFALRRIGGFVGYGAWNRVLGSLFSSLDKTLIGAWLGIAAAGVYAIPLMLVNSLSYLVSYMLGFIFPMASELEALDDWQQLREIYIRSTRFVAALANMIFVPLLVLGDCFLNLWVGHDVADQASGVLRIVAIAGYVTTLTVALCNSVVVGIGRMRLFTTYSTIHALVFAVGCAVLIRPLGLKGAGTAWLCASVVDMGFLLFVLTDVLNLRPLALCRAAYVNPMVLGIGLGGACVFVRPLGASWGGLILAGLVFEVLYMVLGYMLKIFGETERRVVVAIYEALRQQVRQAEGRG